ncbi:MAG: hypothetical protein IPF72_16095 [Chitinophagaceae bacterium]|nr:hypothetical protein [Chitinophagaceae bacterium]
MLEDSAGNIWFATSGGISKYDGRSFVQFTEQDGLISNFVASILQDKNGDFWFGTRYGISWLTAEKLAIFSKKISSVSKREADLIFRNYDYDDGFLGVGCSGNAILESKKGMIWVGTNLGATAFEPGNNFERSIPPDIQITAVKLFNEKIPWGNLNPENDSSVLLSNGIKLSDFHFNGLSNWYHLPMQLSLSYKNNYIVFDFIGIGLNQTQDIQYQYQLEGLDEGQGSLTTQTSASYGNLPAGNYTFVVKAMNSDGYWSKEFKYAFSIRPPWWKTWWFRLVLILSSVLLLFLGSWFIYRYTLRKQRADLEKNLLYNMNGSVYPPTCMMRSALPSAALIYMLGLPKGIQIIIHILILLHKILTKSLTNWMIWFGALTPNMMHWPVLKIVCMHMLSLPQKQKESFLK